MILRMWNASSFLIIKKFLTLYNISIFLLQKETYVVQYYIDN